MNAITIAFIFILFSIIMSREEKHWFLKVGKNTHLGSFQQNCKPFGEKQREKKTKEKKKNYTSL